MGGSLINSEQDPDALADEAIRHLSHGDTAAAELACRTALSINPNHSSAKAALGATLLTLERFGEAEAVFLDLTDKEPQAAPHWINLGNARRGAGAYDEALRAYARAAELGARDADFYFNVGLTHLDRRDFESALAVLDKARELDRADPELTLRYAEACYRAVQNDRALDALREWRNFRQIAPHILAQYAQLLVNLGDNKEGEQALHSALESGSRDALTLLVAIEIAERTNQLQRAQELLAQLESIPNTARIHEDLLLIRARLAQRLGQHESASQLFSQALLSRSDPAERYSELFALAQSQDALGRYEEALATLRKAHASQLEYLRRVAPALVLSGAPPMMITRRGCDAQDISAWQDTAPSAEHSPIFIVSFPRSGTTLLELTLDAHPDLQSMDEQPFVQNALEDIVALSIDYPEQLARLTVEQLNDLRAGYWRRVAGKVRLRPEARLVDKNPLNILRLPVICRLFPNARIILAVRHPCDVLLSNYMQMYRAPEFALLCNSMQTLARGYRLTMEFWVSQTSLLQPITLDVRYESLVANFESEVRSLAKFLAVPWNDAMLEPGNRATAKGFISTPSYSQVVQAVTTKSVGRWTHYRDLLDPALPVLQPQLERWNYST
jgi:tetratricopeptide (TPR) repeat protein